MNPRERGFLLLTSLLGDPERKVLTVAQMRGLSQRVTQRSDHAKLRDLTAEDLLSLGYGREFAERILDLLSQEAELDYYCSIAQRQNCYPLTRVTEGYPHAVHYRLGADSPGCLWYLGDPEILKNPMISVVGSRDLRDENREFAVQLGIAAAKAGLTVVSGNARGTDKAVQQACLDAGGSVVSVVADALCSHEKRERMLYLSEEGYDSPFSAPRALSRNRVIHAMGMITIVVQSDLEKGGSWSGAVKNLKNGWSPVYCYNDGSDAVCALLQMGAGLIDRSDLLNLTDLCTQKTIFDME